MSLQVTRTGLLLCHAEGAERRGGQQRASYALSVPEAELLQAQWAGGSAMRFQACSDGGESLVAGTYPASARACSRRHV